MSRSIPDDITKEMGGCSGLTAILRKQPTKKALKDASKRFSLLSKPVRLRILLLLRHRELCVCIIKEAVSYTDSKLSYHLACLKRAGFIRSRRDHSYLRYSLTKNGLAVTDEVLRMLNGTKSDILSKKTQ